MSVWRMAISRSAVEGTPCHSSLAPGCVCVCGRTCVTSVFGARLSVRSAAWAHLTLPTR